MRILLCAGGTGGHIYPALALARHIKRKNNKAEVLFVGAKHGLESRLVPEAGFQLETISIRPYRKRVREVAPATLDLGKSSYQVNRLLWRFRPGVVLGTGGYVSGPVALWSWIRGYPVLIHEQNAIPGKTNRWLAPLVDRVCISFDYSRRHFSRRASLVLTGNPRASEVSFYQREEGLRSWNLSPDKKTLLVFGGSQGAQKINRVILECLQRDLFPRDLQVIYVTGERYYGEIEQDAGGDFGRGEIKIIPYISNMPLALAAADLVVSRAGATALAEITARGVPSILVPSPNVVHNHQYYNARLLEEQGAARIIEEKDFSAYTFSQQVRFLLEHEKKLEDMKINSANMGMPGAAEKVYQSMQEVMDKSS